MRVHTLRLWSKQLVLLAGVFLVGTGLDWIAHQTSPAYDVPSWYFSHKIIYGIILGFMVLQVAGHYTRDERWRAFWVALIVGVILQFRYFLLGYDWHFLVLFMGVHFVAFVIPAILLFPRFGTE